MTHHLTGKPSNNKGKKFAVKKRPIQVRLPPNVQQGIDTLCNQGEEIYSFNRIMTLAAIEYLDKRGVKI